MPDTPLPPSQRPPVDPPVDPDNDLDIMENADEENEETMADDTHPTLDSNVDAHEAYDQGLTGSTDPTEGRDEEMQDVDDVERP